MRIYRSLCGSRRIAAAKALYEIYTYKEGLLWRKDYLSFDLYCQARFHYTKAHGYRLVETGGFIANLEASSQRGYSKIEPRNEGQIRPLLAEVPKANQVECWTEILKDTNIDELTGPMVAVKAREYVKNKKLGDGRKRIAMRPKKYDRAIRGVRNLRVILKKLPGHERFLPLLKDILVMIEKSSQEEPVDVPVPVVKPKKKNGKATSSSGKKQAATKAASTVKALATRKPQAKKTARKKK